MRSAPTSYMPCTPDGVHIHWNLDPSTFATGNALCGRPWHKGKKKYRSLSYAYVECWPPEYTYGYSITNNDRVKDVTCDACLFHRVRLLQELL